jgi:hypothetical protein
MESCLICGGSEWDPLTNPRADRSMISDLRLIDEPLAKSICRTCGVVHQRAMRAFRVGGHVPITWHDLVAS